MSLFVVSVPIGNPDDITFRAVETLKKVDFLICEEFKTARKLLKGLDIHKDLYNINEHNEEKDTQLIIELLKQGKSAALFSDCGTPLFADPGTHLVSRCHQTGIQVVPVPGASSLLSALAVAGIEIKQFYYAGFLPRKSEERRKTIRQLRDFSCPVVIYDTPYRLKALLEDLVQVLGKDRKLSMMVSLTQKDERVVLGTLNEILQIYNKNPFKKEFVLILEPRTLVTKGHNRRVTTKKRRR